MIIIIGTIDDFLKIPALEKVDFLTYLFIYNVFFVPFIFSIRFYYLVKRDHRRERIKMIYHLPYKPFKFIGLFFFIAFILLFAASFAGLSLSSDTVIAFSPCILFLLWSKEKNENKLIQHLRISSMQTAGFINYAALLIITWAMYGIDYFQIFVYANIFAVPVIYIIVFQLRLMLNKKKMLKDNSNSELIIGE
jgi:hypothetical protein